jgi:hypothetical protein
MPIEATPSEQLEVAVAEKFTGDPTVLLFAGEVTYTPFLVEELTVIFTVLVEAPPQ